jgi:hypothetical protein
LTTKGDLIVRNATVTTRLPVGTNGQVLTADSVDPLGVVWANPGAITSITAYIREEQSIGTNGGTFTSGSWTTRILNTIDTNGGSFISLAANQITLTVGTYIIEATAPGNRVASHKIRFQNITDNTTAIIGTSTISSNSNQNTDSRSILKNKITIASTKVFELQHRCTTNRTNDGLGSATGFEIEIYSIVSITKIS